ncbi:esterase E4 isoform X1 [Nilaparvata lugens]|uniref:esterase E4 isoform X1 n=2 Tax=Nilaparvata lugens TaxID=108931 RepID=UPI00193E81A7|nr:esterase E4 isoform X1 [Nilaparvata lugens]
MDSHELNMCVIIYFVFGFLLNFQSVTNSAHVAPVVTTYSGDVRGFFMQTENNRTIEAYCGIPYAKPPIGSRRFEDPEPFGKWHGVLDGSKEPNRCMQNSISNPGKLDGCEDCLYLSVYTPSSKGNYSVIIFFYGGSFTNGYASTDSYGSNKILTQDVVLVILNYRLGFLGFASFNHKNFSGNYGLKDQSLAIKWVKENSRNFGGDDCRITVMGQSSGAASAHYQIIAPRNFGIIKRAILLSGTVDCPWAFTSRFESARLTAEMGRLVNCTPSSASELKSCLCGVNGSEFVFKLAEFQQVWPGVPAVPFPPCLESNDNENAFITEESYYRRTSRMDIMLGSTSSEGTFNIAVLMQAMKMHLDTALGELDRNFTIIIPSEGNFQNDPKAKERALQLKKQYFCDKPISNKTLQQLTDLYSDMYYLNGTKTTIEKHNGKIHIYDFGYESLFSVSQVISEDPSYKNGACHGDDLLYMFPLKYFSQFRGKESDKDKEISRKIVQFIVNFATYGDPNPVAETTNWSPNSGHLEYLSITREGNFEMKANFPHNGATPVEPCCSNRYCCPN